MFTISHLSVSAHSTMSVDYTAMNPALLSPAQLVTRRMQLRAKEQAPPSSPTQRSNSNINELPAHSPITPLTISTNQIGQRPLPEIADSLKRKFDLQPQDCTELDEFITVCPSYWFYFYSFKKLFLGHSRGAATLSNCNLTGHASGAKESSYFKRSKHISKFEGASSSSKSHYLQPDTLFTGHCPSLLNCSSAFSAHFILRGKVICWYCCGAFFQLYIHIHIHILASL